ncbi:MAG: pyruvate:ferredoxin (flavodoxin) oxidoreductase [Puniceicoccaceae bacterium]
MSSSKASIADGNEAVASVAYRMSETIVIYPITPSSPMAELSDEWSNQQRPNLWSGVPALAQMQSEGGAAGAVHGALQAGTLSTTFTASQGLLLMIPNMYKIAGELTPFCMHVTARSLATHALSIFGDHSDVMACRQTGFALLASSSVQEAHDMAAVAHAATLRSRVPFLHFFDGFRTSHEVNTHETLSDDDLRALTDQEFVEAHRSRAMSPDAPVLRGTAQNPDVFFQAREAVNSYYDDLPGIVEDTMERFHRITGRDYRLFSYTGAEDAEDVLVVMGSGAETCRATSDWLNRNGRKTGVLKVRLFRPFSVRRFVQALPATTRRIAVLDRTKEPGSIGEPLYQDVLTALAEARADGEVPATFAPVVVGGRYGLGSKEYNPAMAKAVFDHLRGEKPMNHFTVGIVDDVTRRSLPVDETFELDSGKVFEAVFIGLGSDGTVGANKNTIKIIGTETDNHAQAYFVYDSKKSGAMTVSHLRFGPEPIEAPYLVNAARFVGCHQFSFIDRIDVLERAARGAVFLLNAPYGPDRIWDRLPVEMQRILIEKEIRFYVIDAYAVARETGMGNRINTIMQTCFFAISGILPREEAIARIKGAIEKTYGRKGRTIVEKNFAAVDGSLANLHEVPVPAEAGSKRTMLPPVPGEAPDFVRKVTGLMLSGKGDLLPVSAFPADGTWPTATSRWEKRGIALTIPTWEEDLCIQCGKCALVCPHAAIRAKTYPAESLDGAPEGFQSTRFRSRDVEDFLFTIQVAPEDCTGCRLCVNVCPAKDRKKPDRKAINMTPIEAVLEREKEKFDFFLDIPETDLSQLKLDVKTSQLRRPLFEFSGACAGCGETPYIKLLTQLMGDRLLIANATGCSSIYGGNLPTTPYAVDCHGRGPTWSNSLFEDNAEFGFGMRMAVDFKADMARTLLAPLAPVLGDDLTRALLDDPQDGEAGILAQRQRVEALKAKLGDIGTPEARALLPLADYLVRKSVWCIGGDGWAYDIGFGGLDHVLASGANINILVLDTEVYSNTGGQASKSTPLGAVAKFAAGGKARGKKDLGLIAMGYGHVYVASVAMGAKDTQTLNALHEADSYDGPSLVIAYTHCVGHGYDLAQGLGQQKLAVDTGYWPIYRFDPRRAGETESPLKLDSGPPKRPLRDYMNNELRFRILQNTAPARAEAIYEEAQAAIESRYKLYKTLATVQPEEES